ncbi:MAG: ribosome recycling factor [Bacteroidia bacterium]
MSDPRLNPVMDHLKTGLDKAVEHATHEFAKIRAGRANVSMLDAVKVDYYGNLVPISQVGNISTPDPKTITVQPWEKSMLQEIERGITKANLGFNPTNDGTLVRISIPALTEERRKEIVKKVKAEAEHAKVAVRTVRKEVNESVKKLLKEGLPEDEEKSTEITIQKLVDACIKKIDDLTHAKEKEIMTV